jgi:hypothetical protein
MRVLAPDPKCNAIQVDDGPDIKRHKDGTFHVPDSLGKQIKRGGEFGVIGITFQSARGFVCKDCGRVNVFKDHCGKCGSTNLEEE